MKKIIVGGKDNICPECGSSMLYLKVKTLGIISQCKLCSCTVQGRARDEVKIYSYEEKR